MKNLIPALCSVLFLVSAFGADAPQKTAKPERKALLIMQQEKQHDWYQSGFARMGWKSDCVAAQNADSVDPRQYDLILIYSYNGNRIPENYTAAKLLPAIRDGAIVVYTAAGTRLEIDRWYKDPALKVASTTNDKTQRNFTFAHAGFARNPHDLSRSYRYNHSFTFVPAAPEKWIPLITNLTSDKTLKPVLMASICGKGLIVCTAAIQTCQAPHEVVMQFENLLELNKTIRNAK